MLRWNPKLRSLLVSWNHRTLLVQRFLPFSCLQWCLFYSHAVQISPNCVINSISGGFCAIFSSLYDVILTLQTFFFSLSAQSFWVPSGSILCIHLFSHFVSDKSRFLTNVANALTLRNLHHKQPFGKWQLQHLEVPWVMDRRKSISKLRKNF